MDKTDISINNRLKTVRESLNFNQLEFAKELGIRQSYYSEVETGKRKVGSKIIQSLRDKFSVSADWLYTGKGDNFFKESDIKSIPKNVSSMYPSREIASRKFEPYDFYKGLSGSDLDFEISIEYERLKGIYGDYIMLSELFFKLNAPDFLKEKFPVPQPFKEYIQIAIKDFEEEHQHIKDESRLKVLKIVDLYLAEAEHWRFLTSKLIAYYYQYSDMLSPSMEGKTTTEKGKKELKDRF